MVLFSVANSDVLHGDRVNTRDTDRADMRLHASLLFVAVYVLIPQVSRVSGLVCLSCSGVMAPRHCHQVETCNQGQHCSVERYFDHFNDVYYNLHCIDQNACPTQPMSPGLNDYCTECCQRDLCNAKGCNTTGYPDTIGPICYSCKSHIKGRACHNVELCDINEVCFVDETEELGDILVDSGCRPNTSCQVRNNLGTYPDLVVGRRSTYDRSLSLGDRSLSHPACTDCCDHDLCNDKCSTNHRTIMTQKPTSSTRAPSTTVTPKPTYRDCLDVHTLSPQLPSGPYQVTIGHNRQLMVWCDMDTAGGGWTVFQKRFDGSVDFYQAFSAYQHGFGNISGEFWLGLENIHQLLVGHDSSLRADIKDANGTYSHDESGGINVGPGPDYVLHLHNASYQMSIFNGQPFTTKDVDRDSYKTGNCAALFHGGFWYKDCIHNANPNGRYPRGMTYFTVFSTNVALEMKFRRVH